VNRAWRERWFELQDGELVYKTKPGARSKGSISLKEAVIRQSEAGRSHVFEVRRNSKIIRR
jgi:hypothetical protein